MDSKYTAGTSMVKAGKGEGCRAWFVEVEAQIRADFSSWMAESDQTSIRKTRASACSVDQDACTVEDPPTSSRSSSSNWESDGTAYSDGRLASSTAWVAGTNDQNQWHKIDIGSVKNVIGIRINNRNHAGSGKFQYIKKFKVKVSNDGNSWADADTGGPVYDGLTGAGPEKAVTFAKTVSTRYIKIMPTDWNEHISGRFGLLCSPPRDATSLIPSTPSGYTSRLSVSYEPDVGLCASAGANTICGSLKDSTGNCHAEYARNNVRCTTTCQCSGGHIRDFYATRLIKGANSVACSDWFVDWETKFFADASARATADISANRKRAACCIGTTFLPHTTGSTECADTTNSPTGLSCGARL